MSYGEHYHDFSIVLHSVLTRDLEKIEVWKQCDCGAVDKSCYPVTHEGMRELISKLIK